MESLYSRGVGVLLLREGAFFLGFPEGLEFWWVDYSERKKTLLARFVFEAGRAD